MGHHRSTTLALLASCAAGTLSAQTAHLRVERVRALGDSTQSYAIRLDRSRFERQ